mmetsp:Transcript_11634/g.17226  ORF Transcript_11634/g.17226 Transcript_11634/m.17226 type:complete len:663 (+) Transcript_11634:24-2012(+)
MNHWLSEIVYSVFGIESFTSGNTFHDIRTDNIHHVMMMIATNARDKNSDGIRTPPRIEDTEDNIDKVLHEDDLNSEDDDFYNFVGSTSTPSSLNTPRLENAMWHANVDDFDEEVSPIQTKTKVKGFDHFNPSTFEEQEKKKNQTIQKLSTHYNEVYKDFHCVRAEFLRSVKLQIENGVQPILHKVSLKQWASKKFWDSINHDNKQHVIIKDSYLTNTDLLFYTEFIIVDIHNRLIELSIRILHTVEWYESYIKRTTFQKICLSPFFWYYQSNNLKIRHSIKRLKHVQNMLHHMLAHLDSLLNWIYFLAPEHRANVQAFDKQAIPSVDHVCQKLVKAMESFLQIHTAQKDVNKVRLYHIYKKYEVYLQSFQHVYDLYNASESPKLKTALQIGGVIVSSSILLYFQKPLRTFIRAYLNKVVYVPIRKAFSTLNKKRIRNPFMESTLSQGFQSLGRMVRYQVMRSKGYTSADLIRPEVSSYLDFITKAARESGDISPLMPWYEASIKAPISSALFSNLLPIALIQIQKQKLDVQLLLSKIFNFMDVNELSLVSVSLVPLMLINMSAITTLLYTKNKFRNYQDTQLKQWLMNLEIALSKQQHQQITPVQQGKIVMLLHHFFYHASYRYPQYRLLAFYNFLSPIIYYPQSSTTSKIKRLHFVQTYLD